MSKTALSDVSLETMVLATMLRDPNAVIDLPATFGADVFSEGGNQRAFAAALRVAAGGDVPTYVAVRRELERAGELTHDASLVLEVLWNTTGLRATEFAQAVDTLVEARRRRRYVDIGRTLAERAADPNLTLAEIEGEHENDLLALDKAAAPDTVSAKQSAIEWEARARAAIEGTEEPTVTLGIPPLDRALTVNKTDLILVGGRPANGKSVLMLQTSSFIAGARGAVMFAGLEMHRAELHSRLLRCATGLRREDVLRPPNMSVYERIAKANNALSRVPLEWSSDPDLDSILRAATRLKRRRGLSALVVDYIQRVRIPSRGMTRDQALGDAAARLKDFAAQHEVPVFAVAALSRESSRRDDPRPRLEDLRESGRLEYEANAVVFVHVPSMCPGTDENKTAKDAGLPWAQREDARRYAEFLLAKNRDGEAHAVVEARHEFEYARFAFVSREESRRASAA